MLSNVLSPGNRIEIQEMERSITASPDAPKKIYNSTIYDVISDDTLEIAMPMEQTKLILLPVDKEYDLVFYTQSGLFQCFARITDRYKSNNIYLLKVEFTSNLRKHQRREYYRFACALELSARDLEKEELVAAESKQPYMLQPGLPVVKSVIVDISGGGLRFLSVHQYEAGSLIYCGFWLSREGRRREYEVVGRVLAVRELPNRKGTYEHRVQFYDINSASREEIIRFIFEEERKSRKKDRTN